MVGGISCCCRGQDFLLWRREVCCCGGAGFIVVAVAWRIFFVILLSPSRARAVCVRWGPEFCKLTVIHPDSCLVGTEPRDRRERDSPRVADETREPPSEQMALLV